jgi:hypothetical protein
MSRVVLIKKWTALVVLTVIGNNLISSKSAVLCRTLGMRFSFCARENESKREKFGDVGGGVGWVESVWV